MFLLFLSRRGLSRFLVSIQEELRGVINSGLFLLLRFLFNDADIRTSLEEGSEVLDLHHIIEKVDEVI